MAIEMLKDILRAGNPSFRTVHAVLREAGLEISVEQRIAFVQELWERSADSPECFLSTTRISQKAVSWLRYGARPTRSRPPIQGWCLVPPP